jgi:hypothetical protein
VVRLLKADIGLGEVKNAELSRKNKKNEKFSKNSEKKLAKTILRFIIRVELYRSFLLITSWFSETG